jgi:hypothetical protein
LGGYVDVPVGRPNGLIVSISLREGQTPLTTHQRKNYLLHYTTHYRVFPAPRPLRIRGFGFVAALGLEANRMIGLAEFFPVGILYDVAFFTAFFVVGRL